MSVTAFDGGLISNYVQAVHVNDFDLGIEGGWTNVLTDSGASNIAQKSANTLGQVCTTGSKALVGSDGTAADNDEAYSYSGPWNLLSTTVGYPNTAIFQFIMGINDASNYTNAFCGIQTAVPAANMLGDDGGGLDATKVGAWFYKLDGGTNWYVKYNLNGMTSTTMDTGVAVAGGQVMQVFEIHVRNINGTDGELTFHIGSVRSTTGGGQAALPVLDANSEIPMVLKKKFTISAVNLYAACGIKNGAAVGQTAEMLILDRFACAQVR